MPQAAGCRILAIMGWGETSPAMVTMHRTLVARLETERPAAVLLEIPYWFQENASDIPIVALRAELRRQGSYPAADAICDALAAAGLELQDTAKGTQWQLPPPGQPLGLTPSATPYLDR